MFARAQLPPPAVKPGNDCSEFSEMMLRFVANVLFCLCDSHLRVDLHEDTTKHSWFRIMPRYKVHTEGDRIRMNDQVCHRKPRSQPLTLSLVIFNIHLDYS
jgi:hypothetical protein